MNIGFLLALNSYATCSLCGAIEIINYKFINRKPKYLFVFIVLMIAIFLNEKRISISVLGFIASYFYLNMTYRTMNKEEIIYDDGEAF